MANVETLKQPEEHLKDITAMIQGQGEEDRSSGDHMAVGATAVTPTRIHTQEKDDNSPQQKSKYEVCGLGGDLW